MAAGHLKHKDPRGGELSFFVCPEVGNRISKEENIANPRGFTRARGGGGGNSKNWIMHYPMRCAEIKSVCLHSNKQCTYSIFPYHVAVRLSLLSKSIQ